ncbi:hypothetical protein MMYC01_203264 [Madurella mycetomatis]|uniref:DUF427 domain-containing protein n=1 Tax=Madurella mycetomatis TaxID=100816 RepID=A0A175WA49_9PEZI|nr:hypothetical protein MMYC01_203264 [Madurella mycetomatis]
MSRLEKPSCSFSIPPYTDIAPVPNFYVPLAAIEAGPGEVTKETSDDKGYWLGMLSVGGRAIRAIGYDQGPLRGLVSIPPGDVGCKDAWFEEDERLLGSHPKDPYKRIDCLSSSREVQIEVDGIVVARSTDNVFLHETGLRTRYYLSPTSILDWTMLSPSGTTSVCPYKGEASYYHVKVGGKEIKDAIWYYKYPTSESTRIQNRLCFYNEKVDVFIDGLKEAH